MGIQDTHGRRPVQEKGMTEDELKADLQALLEETTSILGGTDQTYIQFLQLLNRAQKFSMPSRLFQGQMVFFKYTPMSESFISRNTYYDQYPLVLITGVYRGGFEGVNLHFVDPVKRKFLFDSIMRGLPTLKANETWRTRLMVDYDRLDARRQFKYFRPCYRRYLWKGMKRRPVVVPFELWEDMVMGNTERMKNARPVTVYRETHKQIVKRGR
jgi:hypothetical protein